MTDARPRVVLLRRMAPSMLAAGVMLGGAAALLHSYVARADHDEDQKETVAAPQRVAIEHGETVIRLDTETQRRAGIRLVTLHNAAHARQLRAYATVLDARPLAELRGRYAEAQARRQTAQAKLAASKSAYERARTLYADARNISAAQLQAAEAAFRVDQAELAAVDSQLAALRASARQAWGPVLGRALAEDALLAERLIDQQEFLLQVTLPPGRSTDPPAKRAFVLVEEGTRVPITFISVAPRTDPHIQGASFLYTASARSSLLPGMSAVAVLPSGKTVQGAEVPAAAVVWAQGRASIYLRTGAWSFERRAISTAMPEAGGGYIVQGLPEGVRVVVQGAQMLLSEEYRSPAPAEADND